MNGRGTGAGNMPKITKRNEKGQIMPGGNELSSEEAAVMGRLSRKDKDQDSFEQLLADCGYPDPDAAPEDRRVLAKIAAGGKSQSVMAIRELLKLTNRYVGEERGAGDQLAQLRIGHPCSYCGELYTGGNLSAMGWRSLRDKMDDAVDFPGREVKITEG